MVKGSWTGYACILSLGWNPAVMYLGHIMLMCSKIWLFNSKLVRFGIKGRNWEYGLQGALWKRQPWMALGQLSHNVPRHGSSAQTHARKGSSSCGSRDWRRHAGSQRTPKTKGMLMLKGTSWGTIWRDAFGEMKWRRCTVGDVAEELVGDAEGHTQCSLRCAYEGLQLWVTHARVWTPPRESSQ